ncbi:hypothetical protein KY290_011105 [Solanum tuberosum]|uniref:Uncharacterized protein n=1 Tax=Solanum tuberosum TaxID=4113 RepID=A0ABQ7W1N8_SOLTU|nr:hypothetical protein KY290_011105 [Solanum tuberosum]
MGDEISSRFRDEINSRFQEERVIIETLMDSKLAAMEQRLNKKIIQVIQEQLSRLGIDSTKPATHKPESNSAQTTSRSTILATKGNTPPTYNGTNNPLIRAHRCEHFFEKDQHTMITKKIGVVGFHMFGLAPLWYYQLKRAKYSMSWEEYQRFGPHESSNLMDKLVMLQQTDKVEIYQCQLQARSGIG